jgi:hypothetical protein
MMLLMSAIAGRSGSHDRMQDRAAEPAADNSGQGISNETEALFLQRRARDVATDCTADHLNNQANDVHRLFSFLLMLSDWRREPLEVTTG